MDLPEEILKEAKATAALRGESLRDFVAAALEARLEKEAVAQQFRTGWRSAFGLVRSQEIAGIDRAIENDLEQVDLSEWK